MAQLPAAACRDVHWPDGPRLWFGGQRLTAPVIRRLREHGHGFHPLGRPTPEEIARVRREVAAAGKDLEDFEFVGGTRAVLPDDHSVADLGRAMDPIREQLEAGFTTFCIKPSQFIDDATHLEGFCRDVVARLDVMVGTERAPGQHNSGGDGLFTA